MKYPCNRKQRRLAARKRAEPPPAAPVSTSNRELRVRHFDPQTGRWESSATELDALIRRAPPHLREALARRHTTDMNFPRAHSIATLELLQRISPGTLPGEVARWVFNENEWGRNYRPRLDGLLLLMGLPKRTAFIDLGTVVQAVRTACANHWIAPVRECPDCHGLTAPGRACQCDPPAAAPTLVGFYHLFGETGIHALDPEHSGYEYPSLAPGSTETGEA